MLEETGKKGLKIFLKFKAQHSDCTLESNDNLSCTCCQFVIGGSNQVSLRDLQRLVQIFEEMT